MKHYCTLRSKDLPYVLPPLPPNSTRFHRLLRWMWRQILLDMHDRRTIKFFGNTSAMKQELKRHIKECWYIIHPFSRVCHVLQIIFTITWTYQYFVVPATFAFKFKWSHNVLRVQFCTINLAQVLVYVSFFFTGYTNHQTKEVVVKHSKIVLKYLKTYCFFDTIAVFGLLTHELYFWSSSAALLRTQMPFYAIIALTYVARFRTIITCFKGTLAMMHIRKEYIFLSLRVFFYTFIMNIGTCIVYGLPKMLYGDEYPDGSWLEKNGFQEMEKQSLIKVYFECLIVVVCSFFGAAYGKYKTSMPNEQITICFIMIFGRLFTLFGIAKTLQVFDVSSMAQSKYDQFMDQLEKFMVSKKIPKKLKNRIIKFFQYKLKNELFDEDKITSLLSERLQIEIFLYGARHLIYKIEVLKLLDKVTLAQLFANMKYQSYLPGDVITSYGEELENIYFIESGTVAVYNITGDELCHLHDGDYFGVVNLEARSDVQNFTHIAIEHCDIFHLSQELFRDFLKRRGSVLEYFSKTVSETARQYKMLTKQIKKSRISVLTDLKRGKILETPRRRPPIIV